MLVLGYTPAFGDADAVASARASGIDYNVGSEVVRVADPGGGIWKVVDIIEDTADSGGLPGLVAEIQRSRTEMNTTTTREGIAALRAATPADRAMQREAQFSPYVAVSVASTPAPAPGMSRNVKIAIGVGAGLAAFGLGALLFSRR